LAKGFGGLKWCETILDRAIAFILATRQVKHHHCLPYYFDGTLESRADLAT